MTISHVYPIYIRIVKAHKKIELSEQSANLKIVPVSQQIRAEWDRATNPVFFKSKITKIYVFSPTKVRKRNTGMGIH